MKLRQSFEVFQPGIRDSGANEVYLCNRCKEVLSEQLPQPCRWWFWIWQRIAMLVEQIVIFYRAAKLHNRLHRFLLFARSLYFSRQPTAQDGDGDGQQQERPDAVLKPPAEDQGGGEPGQHQEQEHADAGGGVESTDKNGQLRKDLQEKIDALVKQFSFDDDQSALSRMSRTVATTNEAISKHLTLDDKDSALSRLRRELMEVLGQHAKCNHDFQTEVRVTLESMQARRKEAAASTRHGGDFEAAVFEVVQSESQRLKDVATAVGSSTGLIKNCKKGDAVVELGPESAAPCAKIVVEAKKQVKTMRQDADRMERVGGSQKGRNHLRADASDTEADAVEKTARIGEIDNQLARHTALESELKQLKANIREVERKKDDMVSAARAKISEDEAKALVLTRFRTLLVEQFDGYLREAIAGFVDSPSNCVEQGRAAPGHQLVGGNALYRDSLMDKLVVRIEVNKGEQGLTRLLGLFPNERVHAAFGVCTDFLHRAATINH